MNGGERGGVACFSVSERTGLTALDEYPRSISAGLKQTTPPLGIPNTASDIVFNPSSTALFVAIKGNGFAVLPPAPGYIYVWPVLEDGKVSCEPASVTALDTVPMPFSAQFVGTDDSRLFVTDPTMGAAVLAVSAAPSFQVTVEQRIVISYNLASCWSANQPILGTIYVIDSLRPNITIVDVQSNAILGAMDFKTPVPAGYDYSAMLNPAYGGFDARIDRSYLYVLAGTPGVVVMDTLRNSEVQNIDLSELGSRQGWQGMAVYPRN